MIRRVRRFQIGQQEDVQACLQTYPGSLGNVTGCPGNTDEYMYIKYNLLLLSVIQEIWDEIYVHSKSNAVLNKQQCNDPCYIISHENQTNRHVESFSCDR